MTLRQSNILVVDDDKDVLTAVRFLLKPEVKQIVTDPNPENLRKLLSENDFDILLLDMNFQASVNFGNEGLKPGQNIYSIFQHQKKRKWHRLESFAGNS